MPRTAKLTFILKVSPEVVNTKYGFDVISNLDNEDITVNLKTAISDLPSTRDQDSCSFSYLDESKNKHICLLTMKDLITGSQLPEKTDTHCFWCRHSFKTTPVGCPISFIPNKVTKLHYSEITKDKYKITDNVTFKRKKKIKDLMENHKSKFDILDNHESFFIVDGLFCSFNCCMAFIKDRSHEEFYKKSESLLYAMYNKTFGNLDHNIASAPDWRLLTSYGGPLTIEEFRNSFSNIKFTDINDYIVHTPACRMIGKLYEKKHKF